MRFRMLNTVSTTALMTLREKPRLNRLTQRTQRRYKLVISNIPADDLDHRIPDTANGSNDGGGSSVGL
jgi:hypothetical protein